MNATGTRWTAEQVRALAPDEVSRRAGGALGTAGPWSGAGGRDGVVWGQCAGSGRTPYRTVVDTSGPVYACTCPSRKSPCKHALGLLLLWAAGDPAVPDGAEPPGWAARRLAPRPAPAAAPADPEAARRRAERRAARVTAGAEELERRLTDLVRGGLAAAGRQGYGLWEETAARMVDAQAPGLAARARELGAIPGSGPGWPVRLLEECALAHLLDRAWLAADRLPAGLAATVRTRVGLPSVPAGPAVRDRWLVLSRYDTGDGRLTTRRIWLYGTTGGRTALLLSYGAAGRAPALTLPVGALLDGELTPHAGSGQLRADPGELVPAPGPAAPPPGGPVGAALDAYGRALREDPWLESWPVTLTQVVPAPTEYGWQLADADGREALPLTPPPRPTLWRLLALSGGTPLTVFGECGPRGFTPLTAWSRESPEDPVPLT
ncbi:SWIM zinc finger family protein [Streptomyces sp. R302]|uniref:SWIM zinc finger family protein n=1 Tax=unclassified Streptomyces TaxID=2593676 RepID=UPI00145D2C83|nr:MULTISPECIES: SWIM zinc finger family protein [unclassified Streptomyces]NML50465.1 SWIM zinc finger family protein [Streptomyces sp. R301]NML79456.1 SWIM zinc finger family protein [Streptomyces sp. R302]